MPVPSDPKLFHLMIMEVKDYAISTMDPEGHIVAWNRGAELMNGWDQEEIVGQHLRTLYLPEEKDLAARHLEQAARVGHWEGDGVRLRKNGSSFHAHTMLTVVRHGEHLHGFVKVARDITQEKEIERKFREAQTLNALAAQTAAEGLLMMDATGRVTFVNPAAEEILGWSRDEMLGKVLHEVVRCEHPESPPPPMPECPLGEVLKSGKTVRNREDAWVRRDGSSVPILVSCAPLLFEERVTGAVLALHDVTERRLVEEEARRRAEQLADADRQKDEFLAMLAHELRNPLAPIMNPVQVMQLRCPPDPVLDRTRTLVDQSVRHLARLVDDLLDVSRITRGKIPLHKGARPPV